MFCKPGRAGVTKGGVRVGVDQVGMPDQVVAGLEVRDGHEAAVELEVRVQGRGDLLGVARDGAVEDAVLRTCEHPFPGAGIPGLAWGGCRWGEERAEEEVGGGEARQGADSCRAHALAGRDAVQCEPALKHAKDGARACFVVEVACYGETCAALVRRKDW